MAQVSACVNTRVSVCWAGSGGMFSSSHMLHLAKHILVSRWDTSFVLRASHVTAVCFVTVRSCSALLIETTTCVFQAQILLDCGEDNICVPDLKLAVQG